MFKQIISIYCIATLIILFQITLILLSIKCFLFAFGITMAFNKQVILAIGISLLSFIIRKICTVS